MPTFVDQTFQVLQPSLVHGDEKLDKALSRPESTIEYVEKARTMYAKLLWSAKMKTADQGVTAPLQPPVGDAKTMTPSDFTAYWGTKMECIWGESARLVHIV